MKISYVYPYELTQTPIEVDTEKDFEKIPVKTRGYVESNKFLVALWNQINTNISPKHCVDRAPWAYFPGKFIGKKSSVSVLGFCQTSIGVLYFALEYQRKGDIDSLLFLSPMSSVKTEDVKKLKVFVEKARQDIDKTKCFLCKAKITVKLKNVSFSEYHAKNYSITPAIDGVDFRFYVNAIDKYEAEQQSLERLYEVCAFLSVETNIYCTFEEFTVSSKELLAQSEAKPVFIDDYIDNYPAIQNWKICISKYAFQFIEDNILSLGRFEKRNEIDKFFLSSCKHVQIGLETELKMGDVAVANIPFGTLSLVKRDQRNKIEHMTSAVMSYLSAVECVTATDANPEICKDCGAPKYKIAQRVKDLSTEFLGEYLGKVFHKLYSVRSKFLHAGRMASDGNIVHTMPLLSESSETVVKEYGNVSIKLDGKVYSFGVSNIREWTTYMLRSYYQKRILGRTEFVDVFNEKHEVTIEDFPLLISAVSPEGGEQMLKILRRTDTLKYKSRSIWQNTAIMLYRFWNRLWQR